MKQGSRGIIVSFTLFIVPTSQKYDEPYAGNDLAFAQAKEYLITSIDRNYFADVLNTQSEIWGCEALLVCDGATITYISSNYLSVVTHSAPPSSYPTLIKREDKQDFFRAIIAGTVVGISGFLLVVMLMAYYKNEVAYFFGMSSLLARDDPDKPDPTTMVPFLIEDKE
jgi:hypothetical protein